MFVRFFPELFSFGSASAIQHVSTATDVFWIYDISGRGTFLFDNYFFRFSINIRLYSNSYVFFWYLIFLEGKNISDNHICLEHVYFATFIFVMSICVHSDTFLISQKEEELPPKHLKSHQSIIPKKTGWKSLNTTLHFPLFNRPFQKSTRLKITRDHCTVFHLLPENRT